MGENSKIEWCDHTFNPWRGCSKVSPGCENCYAEKQAKRNPKVLGTWGPNGVRVVASEDAWEKPLKWNRDAEKAGRPALVFCGSMCDVFEDLPHHMSELGMIQSIHRLKRLIDATPNLIWLILTKRPQNVMYTFVPYTRVGTWQWPRNAWLGVSVEDQQRAEERIPELLRLKAQFNIPGVFLSVEPLLGRIDLEDIVMRPGPETEDHISALHCDVGPADDAWNGATVDWVICGGESGPKARPAHPDWVRSIRDQCSDAGVPFFFKQWGEWREFNARGPLEEVENNSKRAELIARAATNPAWITRDGRVFRDRAELPENVPCRLIERVGKARAGAMLDGREWREWPAAFGVREPVAPRPETEDAEATPCAS